MLCLWINFQLKVGKINLTGYRIDYHLILYTRRGCAQCHSIDGTRGTGPSFKGIFGQQHKMVDGSTVKVDEDYIKESIFEPQKKIRDGYSPVMATYKGLLTEDGPGNDVDALIEYIKTLR